MELIKKTNFDFLGKRKVWYLFSGVIILAGISVFIMRGNANFGVDFIGGDLLQVRFKTPTSVAVVRGELDKLGISDITVQEIGTAGNEYVIKSPPQTSARIVERLNSIMTQSGVEVLGESQVSPAMSSALKKRALLAFFGGLFGILLYLTVRFEFHFAACATIATFHDLLFVIAIIAFSRKAIDGPIIAALLTIAGYSVNDTIVIFDRIRENVRKTRSTNYQAVFNQAINETLSRTVLTVLTVLFVDLLLFLLGGEALRNFAYTLLFGFILGAYSSIFIASALLIDWQRRTGFKIKI
jgi:preprotein translocase SecF subunit